MYRQIEKWENIFSYLYIDGKIYTKKKENCILKELSLTGEVLWESEETEVRYYYVNNDVIIFNLESLEDEYTYDRTFIYILFFLYYGNKIFKIFFQGKKSYLYLRYTLIKILLSSSQE